MRKVKLAAIQPEIYPNREEINMDAIERQIETTANLLVEAGMENCDIVCTTEDAALLSKLVLRDDDSFTEWVEKSVPLIEKKYSEIASKYGMYIVGCYNKKNGSNIYNIASIFDRHGQIAGEYRKTHLPTNESWQIKHGKELPVFKLDFGTVGICICYDIMFPEAAEVLSLKGAEIIFHPTVGYGWYDDIGEAALRVRANDNGVYIVTSKNYVYNRAGKSSIIDYWGHVLCEAGFYKNVIVTKEIDLDIKKTQPDWYFETQSSKKCEVAVRMRMQRRPELYSALCDKIEMLQIPDKEEKNRIREDIKTGKIHW